MIQIQNESLIAFRELPDWCQQNLGKRISPSTCHRWRLRGCRGVRLETLLIGGTRMTSVEALQRFFSGSTDAQDGVQVNGIESCRVNQASHQSSVAFLESEGVK